jgi:phosphatidylinositol alpha-1,6-mannosyltransferase
MLLNQFPGLKYLVIGSSQGGTEGLAGQLMALAKELRVEANVEFVGEVPEVQLKEYYALCDVFIMANREDAGDVEGFGIVFLEAGWMGKPVIGGRSGGVPDAVKEGETGLLVDGNSVPDIVRGVSTLLSRPQLAASMGAQGSVFSSGMTASRMFSQYCDTLCSKGL